jgi:hypothetical protein
MGTRVWEFTEIISLGLGPTGCIFQADIWGEVLVKTKIFIFIFISSLPVYVYI